LTSGVRRHRRGHSPGKTVRRLAPARAWIDRRHSSLAAADASLTCKWQLHAHGPSCTVQAPVPYYRTFCHDVLVRAAVLTGRLQAGMVPDREPRAAPRAGCAATSRSAAGTCWRCSRSTSAPSSRRSMSGSCPRGSLRTSSCAPPLRVPVLRRLPCYHKGSRLCACAAEPRACAWLRQCQGASRRHVSTCARSCTVHIRR